MRIGQGGHPSQCVLGAFHVCSIVEAVRWNADCTRHFIQDHGGGSARIKSCQWSTGPHLGPVPQVSRHRIALRKYLCNEMQQMVRVRSKWIASLSFVLIHARTADAVNADGGNTLVIRQDP